MAKRKSNTGIPSADETVNKISQDIASEQGVESGLYSTRNLNKIERAALDASTNLPKKGEENLSDSSEDLAQLEGLVDLGSDYTNPHQDYNGPDSKI